MESEVKTIFRETGLYFKSVTIEASGKLLVLCSGNFEYGNWEFIARLDPQSGTLLPSCFS